MASPTLAAVTRSRKARSRAATSARRLLGALIALPLVVALWAYVTMVRMPGASFSGPFAPLSESERALEAALRRDVTALAGEIGERSVPAHAGLMAAADYIDRALVSAGYAVSRQRYEVGGKPCDNLEAERRGGGEGIIVVGAHYDSVAATTGADDNASGVVALLALARAFGGKDEHPPRTVRFVAFANEEPPYFQTPTMGSVVYAKRARERGDRIVAMLSLETLGYYTDRPRTQHYPFPLGLFYPTTGDFVAFVGDLDSADLVRRSVASFRRSARFPSEGIAAPRAIPGVGWSDHWAFWQEGYPAVMVTDTAPFRNPRYHERTDVPADLTYAPMARVVAGLLRVIEDLAAAP